VSGSYAGIGSRRAPEEIISLCKHAASALRKQGYTLRSGHAPGCDQAFEAGAEGEAEIYLPWPTFETQHKTHPRARIISRPSSDAYAVAAENHPRWYSLKQGSRPLHARNAHQVLGPDLKTPVQFVLCWTPDGSLNGRGLDTGGTGQALRIAVAHSVPVFNLALDEHRHRVSLLAAGS
jgi:hypothetical protein